MLALLLLPRPGPMPIPLAAAAADEDSIMTTDEADDLEAVGMFARLAVLAII